MSDKMTIVDAERFDAVILDLDGVITRTAIVHARAWKRTFDAYLERRRARGHDPRENLAPFDEDSEYRTYVDGKPRYDGVRSFLESRGIELPFGETTDGPDEETICGVGNRKNEFFRELLLQGDVEVFPDALVKLREWRALGLKTAVVSSSRNCALVVKAAGIEELFDARADGRDGERLGLRGKPDPDLFLEGARRLDVDPRRAVVAEDAVAGVEAGLNGGFGLVVGVARYGNDAALREAGAHVVVTNLEELTTGARGNPNAGHGGAVLPSALVEWGEVAQRLAGRKPAVFLDYDGTLTPIVKRPEMATLSGEMRAVLRNLAERAPVAIVSGRDRADVQGLVQLDDLIFAGSHGFDISGPEGLHLEHEGGAAAGPDLDAARSELEERLGPIPGIFIERKRFAIAVHYRNVDDAESGRVEDAVDSVLARHRGRLKKSHGKKVFELRPAIDWDKGKAVLWLLEALGLDTPDVLPIYVGDDLTDEDAFRVLAGRGLGILVGDYAPESPTRDIAPTTCASFGLNDTGEVREFLERIAETTVGEGNA